jgi:hypothetical protein
MCNRSQTSYLGIFERFMSSREHGLNGLWCCVDLTDSLT